MLVHVWEYRVRAEVEAEFRHAYGPEGDWVRLFRRGSGHVETLLLADATVPGRYLTIDRWESAEAYETFRERFADEYAALDRRCERLTTREVAVGAFTEVP